MSNEYRTLISAADLMAHLNDPNWVIVDTRFALADFTLGRRKYLDLHIPGAVFADLNLDLAAPHIPGATGRHPLPSVEQAAAVFARLGISHGVQVVAYDDAGGALAAGRVWWMLRWLGHNQVAVLDGGWQAWQPAGYPVRSGEETNPQGVFVPHPRPGLLVTTAQVDAMRHDPAYLVIDARAHERYLGQNETIDPVAGHIPGAISAPYLHNLAPDGRFLPVDELRKRYEGLLASIPVENTATYCGSGVTSIHNLLAMQHAGFGEGGLYVGSWSEWIVDRTRPVATGEA